MIPELRISIVRSSASGGLILPGGVFFLLNFLSSF